jgi:aldose 1-epimerase
MNYAERPTKDPFEETIETDSKWRRLSMSGWFTPGVVALLCVGLLIASYERGHGNFHKLSDAVIAPTPIAMGPTGPGGQSAIRLTRTASSSGVEPEFLSATLLPGRGMQVLQITAAIPGHGEVPLLVAPTLADATALLTGTGRDAHGALSSTLGGSFEFPWAGQIIGSPAQGGTLEALWKGQRLVVPANADEKSSVEGLLLDRGADSIKTDVLPDGQSLEAVFRPGDFAETWPSSVEVTLLIELSGKTLDLTVKAKNTGNRPEPIGAGWHPYFAIPSGVRSDARLTLPSDTVADTDPKTGMPTGRTRSISQTPLDFLAARGTALGTTTIRETYVNLQSGVMSDGPIVQLSDTGYNYTLRMIPLSANIQRLHVEAPADKPWISVAPWTNANDPFGDQWSGAEGSGIMTLEPGATFEYRVRLEISAQRSTELTPDH